MSALAAGLLFVAACQDESKLTAPGEVPVDVMTATFLPDSIFQINPIDLNGEAIEREWGGPLDTELPYFQIRMSAENGSGDPGEPTYVSVKAVYTERDIYFLFRWNDTTENLMRDALYLTKQVEPGCNADLIDPANWSFTDPLRPLAPRNNEDRFSIAFQMTEAGDAQGTFAQDGCTVACHLDDSPAFGKPDYGRLDLWQWEATRTNPVRDLYSRDENGTLPLRGTPGYLEDQIIDPVTGLSYDPGTPPWRFNFAGSSALPLEIYRRRDDPFFNPTDPGCTNDFGEGCRINNGLELYYIWREDLRNQIAAFAECDSTNFAALPQGTEPRPWRIGDAVSGYWYTYPSGSRADVHGKAALDEDAGIWTLECGRPLDTRDPANDVIFSGVPGEEVVFSIAIFDNSGTVHWGSGPQRLKFGPRNQRRARPAPGGAGSWANDVDSPATRRLPGRHGVRAVHRLPGRALRSAPAGCPFALPALGHGRVAVRHPG
ncbi:MAG: ethylbenzene dehydrogenase-related protein [Candidatus Eisenbacteria bacterium]